MVAAKPGPRLVPGKNFCGNSVDLAPRISAAARGPLLSRAAGAEGASSPFLPTR
jgi:hypothetical protein